MDNVSGGNLWDNVYDYYMGQHLGITFNKSTDEKTKSDILETVKNGRNELKQRFREFTGIDVNKL